MDKRLKYQYNTEIICSVCDKPKYMGYTDKHDTELCTCSNQQGANALVYKLSDKTKSLSLFGKFWLYE